MDEQNNSISYQSRSIELEQEIDSSSLINDSSDSFQDFMNSQLGASIVEREEPYQRVDNKQGLFKFIDNENNVGLLEQDHPQKFRECVKQLQNGDYSSLSLFWGKQVIIAMKFILKHWKMFAPEFSQTFQMFLNICHLNFSSKELTALNEALYSDLLRLNKEISTKLTYLGNKQKLTLNEEPKNNYFLQQFIGQLKVKNRKEGSYFVKDNLNNIRRSLAEYIADHQYFKNNEERWKQILFQAVCLIRYNKDNTPHQDIKYEIENIYKFAQLSIKNHQLGQPCNRLCCSKFMYVGYDICPLYNANLLYRSKLSDLKPYVKIPPKKKLKSIESANIEDKKELQETMLDICGLLNRGGGVILFNVKQEYLELRPYGESLLESQMNDYKEVIKQGIKNIYPKVKFDNQVRVSFVPIVKHPYQYGYNEEVVDQDDKKLNREYIRGLYVMRIVILPSTSTQLYCYLLGEGNARSALVNKGKRVTLSNYEIVEEMRRKFDFFQITTQDEQEAELLAKDYTYIQKTHKCQLPYRGKRKIKEEQPPQIDIPLYKNFKNVSLLVMQSKYYDDFIRRMKNKGIDIGIQKRFIKYNFKSTISSVPILHNERFDQLLGQVAFKKQFQFDGKRVLLFEVTQFIKFTARKGQNVLPQRDYQSLNKWLKKEFPAQNMKYLTFTNQDGKNINVDHYLTTYSQNNSPKTEQLLANLWLYYVLHQFNQKMIFKEPTNRNQLIQKIIYPLQQ